MKRIRTLIVLLTALINPLVADYWQQFVEYEMDIQLDEQNKILIANSELLYVNHSPDTLNQMLMNLYHNAFNEGTIAAEVWQRNGYESLADKDWTGISIHEIKQDSVNLEFLIRDDTILDIKLQGDLLPGDTLKFSIIWDLKIHEHLDRSGYRGSQFDLAQWYPKFVVYDEHGWHDDPFGDYGEFYGEWGNFTVHFDLPASHVVAATGVVIAGNPGWSEVTADTTQPWDDWQPAFKKARQKFLAEIDSSDRRRVTFYAENVHDFAWNSSPNFVYEHDSWEDIDVHVFYDLDKGKEWFNNERRYGAAALEWLSTKFGHYPYPQATIVHSLLSGGMEYPMLIMNGNHSESLVLHEIGHMWFYGIFANDEHDEAWLDEGLTTFQNDWYLEHNYPDNGYAITRKMITPFENEKLPRQMFVEREYKRVIRYVTSPQNEAVATHSPHFVHQYSYYINAYERTSMILHTLKRYLGEERFLAGMQLYFDRWALKHVNEDRFIKAMEDGANEELDWLFDQWLHTKNYMDYGLSEWKVEGNDSGTFRTEVKIHNLGGLFAPIPVTLMGSEGQTFTQILDDYMYRSRNNIIVETDFKPIRVILDKEDIFLDVDRRNNDSKYQFSLRYNFKGWNEYPLDRELYLWKPRIGFNDDNGVGVGIRLDRVYRLPGNFLALELDHNLRSGNPDFGISFQDQKVGLPLQAILRGNIGSWRQITHASMEFELAWAKTFWRKPVHYLTLMADYTDAHKLQRVTLNSESFSRLGINYKLQHKLWGMELGFSAKLQYAPEFLGEHAQDFNQSKLMLTWSKRLSTVRLINRTNVMNNSVNTPGIVSFRLATQDLRSLHMNRISQTLNFTNSIQSMGSHYQVVGGARMRAYTDSLNIAFKHAWSNNFDIVHHPKWVGFGNLGINTFFDIGKYSSDGINWLSVGDLGVGMSIRPTWKRTSWFTTIFRPFTLQFDLPIARIEDGNWEVTDVHKHWIFHVII